jgi:dihydroflavonol-4-reductase
VTYTLVTGGGGFVGQHLTAALLARGERVRVLDIRSQAYAPAGAQYVKGSILDPGLVRDVLADVDKVYHLAALPGMWMPDKSDFHAVNCRGTEIMLEAARARGVARFLHCSTESILFGRSNADAVISEETRTTLEEMPGTYTRSKMLAEQRALAAAASGMPVVIANPTMPIGPHSNPTPPTEMVRYFLNRRLQFYFDFTLNLVDVRDVAAGLVLAMERGRIGERYILGGEDVSLGKLLAAIGVISGRGALRLPVPAAFARTTAAIMEFVADRLTRRPPAATTEGVRIALRSKPLSIEKSRRELGYAPHPIDFALREIITAFLADSQQSYVCSAASYKSEF